ncbi:MAG TPA: energy-coupling factor transporter transmembrane component T [Lachnospiraceae bacterium]|nr:energy-coupling factor transporter transmembrane component T [Lachnospiraceae bacterium]
MLREITLGQYYQTNSVVHRMDARTKLIATFAYIISLFIRTNIYVYLIAAFFLSVAIIACRVPFKHIVKGMKAIMVLLLVTVILNMFWTRGEVIFQIWKISITWEGLRIALFMVFRLSFLILGSNIMTLTTTPSNLTDGLESIMRPLKAIRVPVHEIAMMMSIALRFIPILMEETDKIMKAQLARGADFENGNLIKKAKSLVPILVPLFISAFRRANDLAMAMEARCYRGGDGRTKMKPLHYEGRDYLTFLILIIYLAAVICLGYYVPKFW